MGNTKHLITIDPKTLKQLHLIQLEIVDEVVRICEKHNIHYTLVGGSTLGAIRHKGFIPWDDDIDLGMLRDDYNRFLKICETEIGSNFFVHNLNTDKNFWLPFTKIRKNDTIFDEERIHHLNSHKGIFVDIFPIDNVENPYSVWYKVNAILIKQILNKGVFLKLGLYPDTKKLRFPIITSILSYLPSHILLKTSDYLASICKDDNSPYVGIYGGSYTIKQETYPRSVIQDTKPMPFEDHMYQVPIQYDILLKTTYGDYMKLPPVEKRINHAPLKIKFK